MRLATVALLCASIMVVPVVAHSADILGQRSTDARFTAEGLTHELRGTEIEFYDGSRATYSADGTYAYIYQDGDSPFKGTWAVREAGEVCVTFDNGFARCDHFVRSGKKLTMIIANGDRYPVKVKSALE